MDTRAFSWHILYLRWAGLVSACLGFVSTLLLFISFVEDTANIKLVEAFSGILCILLSYAIGRNILDRIRNHEESASLITNIQARLALVGTRFTFVVVGLIVLFLLVTVTFFVAPFEVRLNLVCSAPNLNGAMRCAREFFGLH